jgi:hypothetical protein
MEGDDGRITWSSIRLIIETHDNNLINVSSQSSSCQTLKQDHHLPGLRGDRVVHVSRYVAEIGNSRWRRRPCRGVQHTDLCQQGSFLLQRSHSSIPTSRVFSITTSFSSLSKKEYLNYLGETVTRPIGVF